MVLPNNQKLLARCSIVTRGHVAHSAVAYVKAFNDCQAKRSRTLDDTATHTAKITYGVFAGTSGQSMSGVAPRADTVMALAGCIPQSFAQDTSAQALAAIHELQ